MYLKAILSQSLEGPLLPLLEPEVESLEQLLGLRLPDPLRKLYLATAQGKFNLNFFENEEYEFEIHELIPAFVERPRNVVSVYKDLVVTRGLIPHSLFPFATGSGGDFFCIDRESDQVMFLPMDPPGADARLVAHDLELFLRQLEQAP
jgi:hypothetical protein